MIYVFLADGFETVEALAVVDVLRRAKLEVRTAGVGGRTVTSAHGVPVVCDVTAGEVDKEAMELLFLPGGIPGTPNLEASGEVQDATPSPAHHDRWIAAICAAPSILGHRGLLEGRTATSFPTFQKELRGANIPADAYVCVDGRYVTGRGMGVAVEFGLKLVELLAGKEASDAIRGSIQCRE